MDIPNSWLLFLIEAIRGKYGYSGGADGSQYIPQKEESTGSAGEEVLLLTNRAPDLSGSGKDDEKAGENEKGVTTLRQLYKQLYELLGNSAKQILSAIQRGNYRSGAEGLNSSSKQKLEQAVTSGQINEGELDIILDLLGVS